jgi:PAS domain S-box-containing protein
MWFGVSIFLLLYPYKRHHETQTTLITVLGEQPADELLLTSGEGDTVAGTASKPTADGHFAAVAMGGGLYTTQLNDLTKPSAAMGMAGPDVPTTANVPFQSPPQQPHQLQYTTTTMAAANHNNNNNNNTIHPHNPKKRTSSISSGNGGGGGGSSVNGGGERKMSEQQKSERRERNREHAKRSRIRKKFLLESLQQSVSLLKDENDKLRTSIKSHLGNEQAESLMSSSALLNKDGNNNADGLLADGQHGTNKVLDDPDFSFIKALQTAQQNFVVTDPSLPDNPIVYASQGFLNLTGYTLDQILGRNCRFLQGPETDPKSVERIRRAIEQGQDLSVCLLNYRVDGTTFWNQFFIAALRDAAGEVTNYVGVQCKVSDQYAASVTKQQQQQHDHDNDHDCDDDDE